MTHQTNQYQFAVTAPAAGWTGRRVIISRHATIKAAEKAVKMAKVGGFHVVTIEQAEREVES
jgi:hypothetical protein